MEALTHKELTREEVMGLEPGDMIRVKVFYPNEPVMKRIAFVDHQHDGTILYHVWSGQTGAATHGDIFAA